MHNIRWHLWFLRVQVSFDSEVRKRRRTMSLPLETTKWSVNWNKKFQKKFHWLFFPSAVGQSDFMRKEFWCIDSLVHLLSLWELVSTWVQRLSDFLSPSSKKFSFPNFSFLIPLKARRKTRQFLAVKKKSVILDANVHDGISFMSFYWINFSVLTFTQDQSW